MMYATVLSHCDVPVISKSRKRCNLRGMREDFLFHCKHEFILLNPEWEVTPCISFIPGVGPCILTCRDHQKVQVTSQMGSLVDETFFAYNLSGDLNKLRCTVRPQV